MTGVDYSAHDVAALILALKAITNINVKDCEKYVALADSIAVDALVAWDNRASPTGGKGGAG